MARAGRPWLAGVLTIGLVGTLFGVLAAQRERWVSDFHFDAGGFLVIMGLVVLTQFLRASIHSVYFKHYDVRASVPHWFALVSVNSFVNYLRCPNPALNSCAGRTLSAKHSSTV